MAKDFWDDNRLSAGAVASSMREGGTSPHLVLDVYEDGFQVSQTVLSRQRCGTICSPHAFSEEKKEQRLLLMDHG
jgi:hypothetical protein